MADQPVTAARGSDALHIYRALFGFLHGHVLNELQELVDNPDETDDLLRLGLYRLPPGEFPPLRSLAPVLAAYDGAAEHECGLDILLTGLTTTLTPRQGDAPSRMLARASAFGARSPDTGLLLHACMARGRGRAMTAVQAIEARPGPASVAPAARV